MTSSTDKIESFKGRIEKIIGQLKDCSFQFKPTKRFFITNNNGQRRPIGVYSLRDRYILKVIVNILKEYYESIFKDSSHGFRPDRTCHTALKEVKT